MADGGKGSRPRPLAIPLEEFDNKFDAIFGKKKNKEAGPAVPAGHCPKCGTDRNNNPCPLNDIKTILRDCPMMTHRT